MTQLDPGAFTTPHSQLMSMEQPHQDGLSLPQADYDEVEGKLVKSFDQRNNAASLRSLTRGIRHHEAVDGAQSQASLFYQNDGDLEMGASSRNRLQRNPHISLT